MDHLNGGTGENALKSGEKKMKDTGQFLKHQSQKRKAGEKKFIGREQSGMEKMLRQ